MPITMTWGGPQAAQAGRQAGQYDAQKGLWEDLARKRAMDIQHAIMQQHYGQQMQMGMARLQEMANFHQQRGDHLEAQLKQQADQFGQTLEQHKAALKQALDINQTTLEAKNAAELREIEAKKANVELQIGNHETMQKADLESKAALAKAGQDATANLEGIKHGHAKEIAGIHGHYQTGLASITAQIKALDKQKQEGGIKDDGPDGYLAKRAALIAKLDELAKPPAAPTTQPAGGRDMSVQAFLSAAKTIKPSAMGEQAFNAEYAKWQADPEHYQPPQAIP